MGQEMQSRQLSNFNSQQMSDWIATSRGTEGYTMKEHLHPRLCDALLPELWRANVSSIRAECVSPRRCQLHDTAQSQRSFAGTSDGSYL